MIDHDDGVSLNNSSSGGALTVLKTATQMKQIRDYIKNQYEQLNPNPIAQYDTRLFRFINMIFNCINTKSIEMLCERYVKLARFQIDKTFGTNCIHRTRNLEFFRMIYKAYHEGS